MSKSKEEILKDWLARYCLEMKHIDHGTDAIPHLLHSAMSQYAEQESISFAEWIDGQQLECYLMTDEGEKHWQYMFPKGTGKESFTTSQLFQLYKTKQTK